MNLGFWRGFTCYHPVGFVRFCSTSLRKERVHCGRGCVKQKVKMQETVQLTEEEKRIFKTLLDADRHFNLGTQLRVAGGWVRDKLLGKDCYDIDIALDNMLGREFCEKINEYLQSIGEETHNVGVIQSNPDQSKHLETARMKLHGVWVDFVNLRAETYADDSRIPTMEFGTPKQDAERRDLTINSLFYNVNTNHVEDYTGRGLEDLKTGTIATPLPPKDTFLDDPLRVLRAIRFGARFCFELTEELKKAAASDEVRAALSKKISRERIGHEIELMLLERHPAKAMRLLVEMELFAIVFSIHPNSVLEIQSWESKCVDHIQEASDLLHCFGNSKLSGNETKVYYLASLLFPLRSVTYKDRKNKLFPVTSYIIKESLKLKTADSDNVIVLQTAVEDFVRVKKLLRDVVRNENGKRDFEDDGHENVRVEAGLLMMRIKELWRAALLLSCLLEQDLDASECAKTCINVDEKLLNLGLEKVWEMKVVMDGKMIMEEVGLSSGGPMVKKWKDDVVRWQLAHPNGMLDDCRHWLKLQLNST